MFNLPAAQYFVALQLQITLNGSCAWAEGVFGHSEQREKGSTDIPGRVHSCIATIARNYNNTSKEFILAGNLKFRTTLGNTIISSRQYCLVL